MSLSPTRDPLSSFPEAPIRGAHLPRQVGRNEDYQSSEAVFELESWIIAAPSSLIAPTYPPRIRIRGLEATAVEPALLNLYKKIISLGSQKN